MANQDLTSLCSTIEEARALGRRFYYPGTQCARGHIAQKRVINYVCVECERSNLIARRALQKAAMVSAAEPPPDGAISRKEAIALGKKRYFTGVPCKRGHIAERLVAGKTRMKCDGLRRLGDEAHKAKCRAYYAKNRERIAANAKEYVKRMAEKITKQRKAYRSANKDRINAAVVAWARENSEKRRAKERAREGRERGAEGTHAYADIQNIAAAQKWLCFNPHCRTDIRAGFHVDHWMPIAKGGSNWPDNLRLLCASCNQSKGAKHPDDWLQEQALANMQASPHQVPPEAGLVKAETP